eukprot:2036455-Pleurochrysis_carterae.AAC.1
MLRRGGWTRLRAVSGQGRRGRRPRPCARKTGNPKRIGRARAKYTCDASAKTASVHAKQHEMGRDGICLNVRHARIRKVINESGGQNAK